MNQRMKKRRRRTALFLSMLCVVAIAGFMLIRYENSIAQAPEENVGNNEPSSTISPSPSNEPLATPTTDVPPVTEPPSTEVPTTEPPVTATEPPTTTDPSGIAVVAQPESVSVLVNKQNKLPENYKPSDLVYPDVKFIFNEKIDKRKMRKEAAGALEEMFAAAKQDGIHLAGVSAYRSHTTQKSLFERYVKKDGMEKALTYSAFPGTSEHETGLSIDVSGSDGKCAAEDCFGDTDEAEWLDKHASEYGFIIRYPEGADAITGYKYEPWHIRYLGEDISTEIASKGITLEEYYNAVPVSK
ncbi:MAG: D-alanyl-D-alanine carboxypeptidase family protein [Candidatus Pristimantibacillus sp.]